MAVPSRNSLLLALLLLLFLVIVVQLGAIQMVFWKLGLSANAALILFTLSVLGSFLNIPLFTVHGPPSPPPMLPPEELLQRPFPALPRFPLWRFHGRTIVALNVGGGLIPALFSLYLIFTSGIPAGEQLAGIAFVTTVSYLSSRPVKGLGIAMPILIAPLAAALVALLLNSEMAAPLAYISGTLGVLLGADLLRLNDIRKLEPVVAAIGGAGTFDGIFITGIVAVLLT